MFDYGKNVRIYAGEDLTQRYYVESSELIILTEIVQRKPLTLGKG